MKFEPASVECLSGYRVNERPVAFTHRSRRYEIDEILDRWYEGGRDPGRPVLDYFKVRTRGRDVVLLRYSALFDAWSIAVTGARYP